MLCPEDYCKRGKSFLYTNLFCDSPVDLNGDSFHAESLRKVLLDCKAGLSKLVLNQFHNGVQHLVFYDDPNFLFVGSISDRLKPVNGDEPVCSEARRIRSALKEVNRGGVYFSASGYWSSKLDELRGRIDCIPEVPAGNRKRVVNYSNGFFGWSLEVELQGSIIEIANMHKVFDNSTLKSYDVSFEKKG